MNVPSEPERMNGNSQIRCGSERICKPAWKICLGSALAAFAIWRASSMEFDSGASQ